MCLYLALYPDLSSFYLLYFYLQISRTLSRSLFFLSLSLSSSYISTFISISPRLSRVKVPHASNADAVSRLTWICKADHWHHDQYDKDHEEDDYDDGGPDEDFDDDYDDGGERGGKSTRRKITIISPKAIQWPFLTTFNAHEFEIDFLVLRRISMILSFHFLAAPVSPSHILDSSPY